MPRTLPDDLKTLPADERLALIDALWDSLEQPEIPLPADHLAELHRRLEAFGQNRDGLRSWAEVRAELEQPLR